MGFQVGQRVADYEILGLLGVGGMGCVYRVRNVISDRIEAMKVLLADLQGEPDLAARFVSEIRTLATLDHPNIAQLHTALQVENELVMVMEFVDGLTLQQLATAKPFPLEDLVRSMHQVLSALGFAHSRGVVHRDIKPANVMVTSDGTVKLTDFGIAKSRLREDLTRPGTTLGSLNYMAPEQAIGGKTIDGRSDLYSLGITMYELLAGCKPFDDESAYVVLHSQLNTAPRPPVEINPLLPKALNDVILKVLEKDPANRYQSAAEFSDALHRATGIGSPRAIERTVFRTPLPIPAEGARTTKAPSPSVTARFPTAIRRRVWVGAGSLAILGIPVVTAVALPHYVKSRALANTAALPIKQWAPPPAAPIEDLPTIETAAVSTDQVEQLASEPVAEKKQPPLPTAFRKNLPTPAKPMPASEETASLTEMPHPAAALSPATTAAVEEVRRQKALIDARAAVVRQSVQHMKSEREANGSTLPEDIAAAYVSMNAYLNAEKSDLEDGDLATAHDHMDKAAAQVATLESLLSK